MNEICDIADSQNTDVVLVAGDLFDTFNPPVEAVDLLYKTLKRLTITGNACSYMRVITTQIAFAQIL
jgi:exonuclease SbcD